MLPLERLDVFVKEKHLQTGAELRQPERQSIKCGRAPCLEVLRLCCVAVAVVDEALEHLRVQELLYAQSDAMK